MILVQTAAYAVIIGIVGLDMAGNLEKVNRLIEGKR